MFSNSPAPERAIPTHTLTHGRMKFSLILIFLITMLVIAAGVLVWYMSYTTSITS